MSIHLSDSVVAGLPQEPKLLSDVSVRLLEPSEQARFDDLLSREHYLKNATVVGQTLRYVAEYERQWLALLVFSSAAFHIKPRDHWLHWSARQVAQRRHLIAQNQRFLVLAAPGRWPNLASRVLKLTCDRLAQDWQQHFGHPVLAVETFVDPQQFRGTCYKAAGWERLARDHARFSAGLAGFLHRHPASEGNLGACAPFIGVGATARVRTARVPGGTSASLATPLPGAHRAIAFALADFSGPNDRSPQAQGQTASTGDGPDVDRSGRVRWLQKPSCHRRICPEPQPRSAPKSALPPSARNAPTM